MKLIILACALVAVAMAAPQKGKSQPQVLPPPPPPPPAPLSVQHSPDEPVYTVRSDIKQEEDGSYSLHVETSDGTHRQETGELVEIKDEDGKPVKVLIIRGSYGYRDPDGNSQDIAYVADQNGFRAEGPSIPKVPESSRR